MQVNTVPKEVVLVTRLLWVSIVVYLLFGLTVIGSFGIYGFEQALVRLPEILLRSLLLVVPILGLNYFLLKGNKWSMRIIIAGAILTITGVLSASQNALVFHDKLLIFGYFLVSAIQTVIAILIIYFLIKKRHFFN